MRYPYHVRFKGKIWASIYGPKVVAISQSALECVRGWEAQRERKAELRSRLRPMVTGLWPEKFGGAS